MSECDHNCESCNKECDAPRKEKTHALSDIKRVIAVMSGKGGVGKSAVTALLAIELSNRVTVAEYSTPILRARLYRKCSESAAVFPVMKRAYFPRKRRAA